MSPFHQQTSLLTAPISSTVMKPLLSHRRRFALLMGILAIASSSLVQAQSVPNRIDYQGQVVDGNGAPLAASAPANYEMEFRVYDADTGGAVVWAEKQLVTVNKGQFSVRLGEGQPILSAGNDIGSVPQAELENAFNGSSRHLGLTVNIPGQTPGEITPRLSFLSTPFALKAGSASSLNQAAGTSSNLVVGSLAHSTFVLNTAAQVDGSQSNVVVDATTGALATSLPLSGSGKELVFTKQDASANVVAIDPPAGGTINGDTNPVLLSKLGDSVTFRNVGANAWWIVSRYNVNAVNADTSGNVEVPGKLTVTGGVLARGGAPGALGVSNNGYSFSGNGGDNDSGLFSRADGTLELYTQNLERMRINDLGAIGVGTGDPGATLHVIRNDHTAVAGEKEALRLEMPGSSLFTQFYRGDNGDHYIRSGQGTGQIYLQDIGGGHVVVGGAEAKGRLTVWGSKNSGSAFDYAFFNRNGSAANSGFVNAQVNIGLWVQDRVVASEFNATSDQRIKSIKGVSNGAADLTTLNAIQVTDYTFRDTLKNGTTAQKKVIAQQVEKVFPQAVSKTTDVVPDIMKMAEIKAGWISLSTDLKRGEKVRLLAGKDQGQVCEVLEVKKDGFRVAFETEAKEVFVYGREVSDFRTVDYDALAMLNVSATQQVKKDSDSAEAALRAENAALKAQVAVQEKRLAAMEQEQGANAARFAALEAALLKSVKNVAGGESSSKPAATQVRFVQQ